MELLQKYLDGKIEDWSAEEKIVFKIFSDIKARKGVLADFNSADNKLTEEILKTWLSFVKGEL